MTLLGRDSCSTENVVVAPAKGHIGVFYLTVQIMAYNYREVAFTGVDEPYPRPPSVSEKTAYC
jgi:hypothetical protein